MGIKIIRQRYRIAAPPEGCRWCGTIQRDHAQAWIPGHKWHGWETPTTKQIQARMHARDNANRTFVMPDSSRTAATANQTRTQV